MAYVGGWGADTAWGSLAAGIVWGSEQEPKHGRLYMP